MSKTKQVQQIQLSGTITLGITKTYTKEDLFQEFIGTNIDIKTAEKIWAALVKKADKYGEIDLGHLRDAEEEDDLDYEFEQLVEEEKEKVQSSSSPDPQQLSSSPVLSSSSSSASS